MPVCRLRVSPQRLTQSALVVRDGLEKFRLKHGQEPTAKQKRTIALFPSRVTNPTFARSVATTSFNTAFKNWIESDRMGVPGHTTHQARHTLATRLATAGASIAHVNP